MMTEAEMLIKNYRKMTSDASTDDEVINKGLRVLNALSGIQMTEADFAEFILSVLTNKPYIRS